MVAEAHDTSEADLRVEVDGAIGRARQERHGWEIELSAGAGRLDVATAGRLLTGLVGRIAAAGGGTARWRVPVPTPQHDRIAAIADFDGSRTLVQLRRALPAPAPDPPLATRAFVPGIDDDEWLRVNDAAFDWHPEQGGWTTADLAERLASEWFDPEGFLLVPAAPGGGPGSPIAGFCWTKVHADLDPPLGEIFVIAVDPSLTSRGLGRRLVLAGLAHLHGGGIAEAMLYTEADNLPARRLYDALGFHTHHEVRVFQRSIEPQTPTPTSDPIP